MDAAAPANTEEIQAVLARYLAIQDEERRIRQEKAELQERLAAHMGRAELWDVRVADKDVRVRCQERTEIQYDEDVLRKRLGDRYTSILVPDLRKMRAALGRLQPYLEPALPMIGSPDPERVKAAIQSGTVRKEEFAGAFEKTVRHSVRVAAFGPGG